MSGGKRVIPVLVDGGSLPGKQDLPPALAALAGLQAKTVTAAKFDQDMEDLVNAILGRPPRGARGWLFRLAARMRRSSLAVASLVGLSVIAFAWANIFDLLGLDTRTASLTMLLGDVISEVPLNERLMLVGIRPAADETNGLSPSRRAEYARLIDTLAQAGARTVAFDIRLESPSDQLREAPRWCSDFTNWRMRNRQCRRRLPKSATWA